MAINFRGRGNFFRKSEAADKKYAIFFIVIPRDFMLSRGNRNPRKVHGQGLTLAAGTWGWKYILKGGMGQGVPIFRLLAKAVRD